jgi:hypothetical protein
MSPFATPRSSTSTHSMRESVHLIWIDSQTCDHSSQTQSSRGPAWLRFARRIVFAILKSSISKVRCVRDKTFKKILLRSCSTLPRKWFHTSHQEQEHSQPSKWQESWCHRSEWPRQGSAYARGYLRHHWPTFDGLCPKTWCPPHVQHLVLAWITIIDWEYKKWLPLTDWFNNRPKFWICRDQRRRNVVALPSLPPPSRHLRRRVLNELYLTSREVFTQTRLVLSCMRLVLSWSWAVLQNYTSHKI